MFWWGPFVLIAAFCAMEFMAWVTHRFVMHGPMWFFHADHHVEKPGFFERNDVFFLIYAIPSWLCIMLGMIANNYFPVWAGYGIAAYGFAYFMIHDVYIVNHEISKAISCNAIASPNGKVVICNHTKHDAQPRRNGIN